MTRGTPAAERTVDVLNLLAAHAGRPLGLSEIARRVGISKGSAHALVTTLVSTGYLVRHPADKTYVLGAAVVALGRAAAATEFGALDFARPAMERLTDDLGLQCLASAAIGDEIVILGKAGATVPLGLSVEIGQRIPLVPPLGTVFVAWSTPAEIDGWLRRLGATAGEEDLARYRDAVATVRQRGYSVALEADARARLGRALAALGPDAGTAALRRQVLDLVADLGHEEYILGELTGAAAFHVNHLAAPVVDADGRVVLALTLLGFTDQLAAVDVAPLGQRLIAEAGSVSDALRRSRRESS
jgi:DNA-binding IclR family transcriptional regulator